MWPTVRGTGRSRARPLRVRRAAETAGAAVVALVVLAPGPAPAQMPVPTPGTVPAELAPEGPAVDIVAVPTTVPETPDEVHELLDAPGLPDVSGLLERPDRPGDPTGAPTTPTAAPDRPIAADPPPVADPPGGLDAGPGGGGVAPQPPAAGAVDGSAPEGTDAPSLARALRASTGDFGLPLALLGTVAGAAAILGRRPDLAAVRTPERRRFR